MSGFQNEFMVMIFSIIILLANVRRCVGSSDVHRVNNITQWPSGAKEAVSA